MGVAQRLERQVVVLKAGGSKPLTHPIYAMGRGEGMDKQIIVEKIKAHTVNNKISCKQALRIAEEEQVPSVTIGEMLNELGIKVANCQLGCFP